MFYFDSLNQTYQIIQGDLRDLGFFLLKNYLKFINVIKKIFLIISGTGHVDFKL